MTASTRSASEIATATDAVARARRFVSGPGPTWPPPGSGDTDDRLQGLADQAHAGIATGRLIEAHADAEAILHDLGGPTPGPTDLWGVWAAESTGTGVAIAAHDTPVPGSSTTVSGVKPWCSGAVGCTHALMTATHDGRRHLVAVDLSEAGVSAATDDWVNAGMRETNTHSVTFETTPAVVIADADAYLHRPGFWHGAVGVAACWFGGAERVADRLRAHHRDDDLTLMHVGAVDAALWSGRSALRTAAADIDRAPDDLEGAHVLALRVRAHIESVAGEVIERVGRCTGPGPLATDADHAAAVADLTVYIRQSHAERDLAALGALVRSRRDPLRGTS